VAHASISILLLAFLALLIDDKSGAAGMTATTRKKQQNYESAPQTRSPTPTTLTTHTHSLALAHSHSQRMLACRGGTKKTTKKGRAAGVRARGKRLAPLT